MSIRFKAAGRGENPVIARVLTRAAPPPPANDTGADLAREQVLRLALNHFAEHGLAAAERARDAAEQAYVTGERDQCLRWLAICDALDRRMAAAARRRLRGRRQ